MLTKEFNRKDILKALLLGCSQCDSPKSSLRSLDRLSKSLAWADIKAAYYLFANQEEFNQVINTEQPDIVYCCEHRIVLNTGEQINVQALLDERHVPYIGSCSDTLDLVLSKFFLKRKWISSGVLTPPFCLAQKSGTQQQELDALQQSAGFPFILKPDAEGNSRGLDVNSIVFDSTALETKLVELSTRYGPVLVEKYLGLSPDIREFTVAMIGNGRNKILMPAEITLIRKKSLRIITTDDKERHFTQAIPVSDRDLHGRLVSVAEKAFDVAGVRDYSRCDLLLVDGDIHAIEINGQPMIPDKWFQACASGVGLDADQYLNAIFLAGIVRNIREGKPGLTIPPGMEIHLPEQIFNLLNNS